MGLPTHAELVSQVNELKALTETQAQEITALLGLVSILNDRLRPLEDANTDLEREPAEASLDYCVECGSRLSVGHFEGCSLDTSSASVSLTAA